MRILPKRFWNDTLDCRLHHYQNYYYGYHIVTINDAGIAWLEQSEYAEYFADLILLLKELSSRHDKHFDFDKYIDEWTKENLSWVEKYINEENKILNKNINKNKNI